MERSVSDFGLLRGQSAEDDKEGKRRPKRTPETPPAASPGAVMMKQTQKELTQTET